MGEILMYTFTILTTLIVCNNTFNIDNPLTSLNEVQHAILFDKRTISNGELSFQWVPAAFIDLLASVVEDT